MVREESVPENAGPGGPIYLADCLSRAEHILWQALQLSDEVRGYEDLNALCRLDLVHLVPELLPLVLPISPRRPCKIPGHLSEDWRSRTLL